MRGAAFFDLDGTLLTVNSGRLWMLYERREGRLNLWQLLQGSFYLLAYRVSVLDMDRVMEKALATVMGQEEDLIRRRTEEWFEREVKRFFAPGAAAVLEEHRRQGRPLVLLTSSSPYESQAACRTFGLDDFISTRYQVQNGRFTGKLLGPACYGEGKIYWADRYAAEHGIDLGQSFFYADSHSDRPMLERVGFPQVVNPDARLARYARRRGWPAHDWRLPPGG